MCHLCVSYSEALTQNEVSPSSRFDESMVIACVCACACVSVCACVCVCVCVWVPVCWHTQKGLSGGDTREQNWWWKYDISRCIWSQPVLGKIHHETWTCKQTKKNKQTKNIIDETEQTPRSDDLGRLDHTVPSNVNKGCFIFFNCTALNFGKIISDSHLISNHNADNVTKP